jgi:hypothetical protein
MHNGYFYPQDIKVTVKDGIRVAEVGFTLPTKWTEESTKVSVECFLSGWEMARRAYEEEKTDRWLKTTYPKYYWQKHVSKEFYKAGICVGTLAQFEHDMKQQEKDITEND